MKGTMTKSIRDPKKTPTVLLDWVIKPVPEQRGICVEGQLEGSEDFWHSSTIVEARKPKLVSTVSGSLYKLKGKINRYQTIDNGVSPEVAKAFSNGFPSNWKKIIQELYYELETSITVTQECMSPEKFIKFKTRERQNRNKLNKTWIDDDRSIITPMGLLKQEMKSAEVTTTRSGRMSLPPLAGWVGQRYARQADQSICVVFNTNAARQALKEQTRQVFNLTKTQKRMICQNVLSKSFLETTFAESENFSPKTSPNTVRNRSKKDNSPVLNLTNAAEKDFQPYVLLTSPENKASSKHTAKGNKRKSKSECKENQNVQHSKSLETHSFGENNISPENTKQKSTELKKKSKPKLQTQKKQNTKRTSPSPNSNKAPKTKKQSVSNSSSFDEGVEKCCKGDPSPQEVSPKRQMRQPAGNNRSRKRTAEDVDKSFDGTGSAENRKRPPSKKQKLESLPSGEVEWTRKEKAGFNRALRDLSGDDPDYWYSMSQMVGTKSEEECLQYHRQYLEEKSTKSKPAQKSKPKAQKKEATGKEKSVPIQARKGTLKRKQEIREFLEEQNEGYEDDLFEGSPFIKLKQTAKTKNPFSMINLDQDDADIFGTNHNFFTPVAGRNPFDTPGTRFKAKLASVKKTPACQAQASGTFFTPEVSQRQHDVYIKNFMDRKKKVSPIKEKSPPSVSLESSELPIKSLFPISSQPIIFEDQVEEEEEEEDEDEDNRFLYHWNDDN